MPSVESRELKDGTVRYFVRIRDPRPGAKQGKFSSRTFATAPEAERFCRDVADRGAEWTLDEYDRGQDEAGELTLDEWATEHFQTLTRANRATVGRYERLYRKHWSPELGQRRLSEITRRDVARALNGVPGKDKTVANAWGVLTHMLKMAAQDGLIDRSPTIGVRPERRTDHERQEHRYLTHAEFWRVLDATPPYWRPLIMMLVGTGMRWGELAALEVGDVDIERRVVRIVKAEKQDPDNPNRRIVGPTKSKKSRRTVTLPGETVEAIRPLLDRPRRERLFLPPRSQQLRHKTFYVDIWQKKSIAGAQLGDPQPRIHDLRHTHVAWLIASDVPLPVIQARLGHESITTTIDTYGHLLPDVQRAAAEAANVVLRRPEADAGPAELEP